MSNLVQQLGNLSIDSGVASLNALLANRSYVEGYTPSQADVSVLATLGDKVPDAKYPHARRWYNHLSTFPVDERKKFPGVALAPAPGGVPAVAPAAAAKKADDDDDIDLFGSDDEVDEEAEKARQERLKAYAEKKAKKPALVAKSSVVLDVKPWDDETDMKEMEKKVREIEMDGLLWGASKLVPLAYGIKKLQIMITVEDDKVSIEELQEKIEAIEDLVQSVDIAAFNKI